MAATPVPALPVLPDVVTRYLAAHDARDAGAALVTMHEDATVTDDGSTYAGAAAIGRWLGTAASEYTYTTQLLAAEREDDAHYAVTNRLEGNFPGGRVDLRFRFTLRDGLIEDLTIAP
ncbi:nuclear transport factor 2 family protein [Streptomyces sp. NPDC057307]|uniref:nuclear transport factor 2 family protein n=1 Tax=Streptomyces sp. NPDC057307 TaxID=3346096 RepID=UPI0036310C0D